MSYPHVQIPLRTLRRSEFGTWGDAHLQTRLDHAFLRRLHVRVAEFPNAPDAHRIVCRPELHHIHTLHRQEFLQILHGRGLLHHHGHHRILHCLYESQACCIRPESHRAPHTRPVLSARLRRLRPNGRNTLTHVLRRTKVSQKHVLDSCPDRAACDVSPRLLLDLDHGRHVVEQLHRAGDVLKGVKVVRCVFGHIFYVVEHAGLAHHLHDRWPGAVDVCAQRRLA